MAIKTLPPTAPQAEFHPHVPAQASVREFTPRALIVGTLLGVVFGASSLYLVLKVGITVSASIPVAVISITLFRILSKIGVKDATILEHNIVQTAGSAGESLAFGVGVTMPAIMILGFDLEATRVTLVAVLGGLLGVLMMIPTIKFFGDAIPGALEPGKVPISKMGPDEIRGAYVLYIGAGAVAAGGIISLVRSLPLIWHGIREGLRDVRGAANAGASRIRTENDLPMKVVGLRIIALLLAITFAPKLHMNALGAILIVGFGFLFVTVSSRLTG